MLMKFLVILKNVKSMINMVRMHSRKELAPVAVACMTRLTSSRLSLVGARLGEVRYLHPDNFGVSAPN